MIKSAYKKDTREYFFQLSLDTKKVLRTQIVYWIPILDLGFLLNTDFDPTHILKRDDHRINLGVKLIYFQK